MGYSLAQMQNLLRSARWPENLIPIMAAIGMAESSGQACIVGRLANNEYSVGLWQININPTLRRPWTQAQLCDPLFNAKVALEIYRQQGLRAWGAYTDGRYKRYYAESQRITPGVAPVVTSAPSPVSPIPSPGITPIEGDFFDLGNSVRPEILLLGAAALVGIYLLTR